jgi:hypothetical protein
MNDVDVGIGDERRDRVECGLEAKSLGGGAGAAHRRRRSADQLGASCPSGTGMHGGHEAAADEAGAERSGRGDDVRCHVRHADTPCTTFGTSSSKVV